MKGTSAALLLKAIKKPFMNQFQVPEHVFSLLEQLADVNADDLDNVEVLIEAVMPMLGFLLAKALHEAAMDVSCSAVPQPLMFALIQMGH
jgi:hypothetical protein